MHCIATLHPCSGYGAPTSPPIKEGAHYQPQTERRGLDKETALLADMAERSTNLASGYNSQKSARGTQVMTEQRCNR